MCIHIDMICAFTRYRFGCAYTYVPTPCSIQYQCSHPDSGWPLACCILLGQIQAYAHTRRMGTLSGLHHWWFLPGKPFPCKWFVVSTHDKHYWCLATHIHHQPSIFDFHSWCHQGRYLERTEAALALFHRSMQYCMVFYSCDDLQGFGTWTSCKSALGVSCSKGIPCVLCLFAGFMVFTHECEM